MCWKGKYVFYVTSEISDFFCLFFLLLLCMPCGAGAGTGGVLSQSPSIQGKVPRCSCSGFHMSHAQSSWCTASMQKLNVGSFLMCSRNLMWLAQGHSAGQKLFGVRAVNSDTLWVEDQTVSPRCAVEGRAHSDHSVHGMDPACLPNLTQEL